MSRNVMPFLGDGNSCNKTFEEIVRTRIQEAIRDVFEEELLEFLESVKKKKLTDGKQAVTRNGYHKERKIQTTVGSIMIKIPRTRDRSGGNDNFKSCIIPAYKRRTTTFDEAVCYFYLKGISTGQMLGVLQEVFGDSVNNLSATTVSNLLKKWQDEYLEWSRRDLSKDHFCYVWVDGIHFNVRREESKLCTLVVMGATKNGVKKLIAVEGGYRESKESWATLLRQLKTRGMNEPKLCIGDGVLGFWSAVKDVFPSSKCQLCWVHKTANVLDKLPKSQQGLAKDMLKEIYMAATKKDAEKAFENFEQVFDAKYPRAVKSLTNNYDMLMSFYDFPAMHWIHVRTTNPIESTFATVRHRTARTRGNCSRAQTLALAFKLAQEAAKGWRKLKGHKLVIKVMEDVKYIDGEELAA